METILNIQVTFNLNKVNNAIGNTDNVKAEKAILELLVSAIGEYGTVDSYGDPLYNSIRLNDYVSFKILE